MYRQFFYYSTLLLLHLAFRVLYKNCKQNRNIFSEGVWHSRARTDPSVAFMHLVSLWA
jgi:hypothetical protein